MKTEIARESREKNLRRAQAAKVTQKRALVIEDEPETCEILLDALRSAEIENIALMKSAEADGRFHEEKFDVAFIGRCETSAHAIELVRSIRKSNFNRKTPIIMISEGQEPDALSRGFEAGVTFFVYKPVDKAHLMRLLRVSRGTIEQERRRFRRVRAEVKVRLKSDEAEVIGETIDISMNGALVRASQALRLGSLVEVSLYLQAGTEPVVGLGSVARILNSTQMGILLDRLPPAQVGRLQEFLLPRIADE